jgi:hypothetical protein
MFNATANCSYVNIAGLRQYDNQCSMFGGQDGSHPQPILSSGLGKPRLPAQCAAAH